MLIDNLQMPEIWKLWRLCALLDLRDCKGHTNQVAICQRWGVYFQAFCWNFLSFENSSSVAAVVKRQLRLTPPLCPAAVAYPQIWFMTCIPELQKKMEVCPPVEIQKEFGSFLKNVLQIMVHFQSINWHNIMIVIRNADSRFWPWVSWNLIMSRWTEKKSTTKICMIVALWFTCRMGETYLGVRFNCVVFPLMVTKERENPR